MGTPLAEWRLHWKLEKTSHRMTASLNVKKKKRTHFLSHASGWDPINNPKKPAKTFATSWTERPKYGCLVCVMERNGDRGVRKKKKKRRRAEQSKLFIPHAAVSRGVKAAEERFSLHVRTRRLRSHGGKRTKPINKIKYCTQSTHFLTFQLGLWEVGNLFCGLWLFFRNFLKNWAFSKPLTK